MEQGEHTDDTQIVQELEIYSTVHIIEKGIHLHLSWEIYKKHLDSINQVWTVFNYKICSAFPTLF